MFLQIAYFLGLHQESNRGAITARSWAVSPPWPASGSRSPNYFLDDAPRCVWRLAPQRGPCLVLEDLDTGARYVLDHRLLSRTHKRDIQSSLADRDSLYLEMGQPIREPGGEEAALPRGVGDETEEQLHG